MEAVEDKKGGLTPSPWTSIWTKPRDTVQRIINHNPEYGVLVITCFAGILSYLENASSNNLGDKFELASIVTLAVIVGPIFAVIGLYIGAWLFRVTGNWIGGKATSEHFRTVIAWSNVPSLVALALYIPQIWIYGSDLFTTDVHIISSSYTMYYLFLGFVAVRLILMIWSLVILVKGVAQAQGFSAWKGLGNVLLAFLVPAIIIGLILSVIVLSSG